MINLATASMSDRTVAAGQAVLAGARHGYTLLWVVLLANLMAMLFQALSAKLGIVTGSSLAAQCRDRFPPGLVIAMWLASEVAAMATDLAEFLGGAIGLSLLFDLPLLVSLVITGVVTYVMLMLSGRGFRPLELVIAGFVAVIGIAYALEIAIAPPVWASVGMGLVVPHLANADAVMLSVAIVGSTVMPHALYLHSALTSKRMPATSDAQRRRILRFSNWEVLVALGFAGVINLAMIIMAAATFHDGHPQIAEIETAYHTLVPLFGAAAGAMFMTALLASGLSSSVVGTLAGQIIMQDFVHIRLPLWLRRLVTMLPSVVVVAWGFNSTDALVMSQVVLSLVLPVPVVALIFLTGRREVMGDFVNSRGTQALAIAAAVVVVVLNAILLAGIIYPDLMGT